MDKPNKVHLLAAVFMIVAPLSISGQASEGIKYLRLVVTAGMAGLGMFLYEKESFGSLTKSFVFFCSAFTASALWSDNLFWAAFYKSSFLMAVLGGVYMGYTLQTRQQLTNSIKLMANIGTIGGLLLFVVFLMNPETNTVGGRMAVGGMNANTIGAAAAPMFVLAVFMSFWQEQFKRRIFYLASATLLAITILGSGSRGATLMAIVGTLMAIKPFLQKRAATVILAIALPLGSLQIVSIATGFDLASKIPGLSRITEGGTTENTREGMWEFSMKRFYRNPGIGCGWLHFGNSQANSHSIYIQVLAESGLVGGTFFVIFVLQLLIGSSRRKNELYGMASPELLALPMGIVTSVAVHGMVEASALFGTTSLPLLFGFSIALIDRLPDLMREGTLELPPEKPASAVPRLDIRSTRSMKDETKSH